MYFAIVKIFILKNDFDKDFFTRYKKYVCKILKNKKTKA